ncbi:C-terminal processing protease CtpA/Prc, contains a PDZ domain [Algibacter pectinivorans]|uniref:C-terminal processing protease CtpA/Prc, contains a PDZ domain n=2 Tax=Algibacter pectinivorans TaxID=870482 RepID=A0A1I1P2D5_9FLAO|nr:C-terminal processing protease CtpA/Prc, contains a PDZ domain [Algibacter pectinivorans]
MKKMCYTFILLAFLVSCKSVEKHNTQITKLHTIQDLHQDIDKLYKQLKRHHPKLYQYTPKAVLDFKFDSLKQAINRPMDSRAFYKQLAPVVAQVKQGHVSVGLEGKRFTRKELKALKKKKFEFYDLDIVYLEGKLWVKNYKGNDSTLIGKEIVRINGESATKLAEVYKTRFASDGYNKTLYNRYVSKSFSLYYYRDKGFLDSLQVTFKAKDSVFSKVLRRIDKNPKKDNKDSISASAEDIKPKKRSLEDKKENRLAKKQFRKQKRKRGYIPKDKNFTRNFKYIGKDSTIAYMKLRSFTNGNYKRFYKEVFAKIDAKNTSHFILDLRDNGGGRIAEIDYLYGYLANKPFQFIKESEVMSRTPFIKSVMSNTIPNSIKVIGSLFYPVVATYSLIKTKTYNDKIYFNFNKYTKIKAPKPLAYTGKLYVLINGNSFSASSILSTHLKATKRATFIGEETGGAYNGTVAGVFKIYKLPESQVKVGFGLMQIEAPQKQNPDGFGIKPDVKVVPNIMDIQSGIDTELEWILKDIYNLD